MLAAHIGGSAHQAVDQLRIHNMLVLALQLQLAADTAIAALVEDTAFAASIAPAEDTEIAVHIAPAVDTATAARIALAEDIAIAASIAPAEDIAIAEPVADIATVEPVADTVTAERIGPVVDLAVDTAAGILADTVPAERRLQPRHHRPADTVEIGRTPEQKPHWCRKHHALPQEARQEMYENALVTARSQYHSEHS